MESVESVCLEAGGALRLKLGQVQIPSGPHTVLRTTYAFESPRAEGFNENCIDAGLLHTNYRELTANYHLIIGGISGIGGIGGIGGISGITWFT